MIKTLILHYRFWKMRRDTAPTDEFVARLGRRFSVAASPISWYATTSFRRGFAVFSILVWAGASTTSYAYAAEDLLLGDAVYPIRQGVEAMQYTLAKPAKKKQTIAQQIARRKQEIHQAAIRFSDQQTEKESLIKAIESDTGARIDRFEILSASEKALLKESVHDSVREELDNAPGGVPKVPERGKRRGENNPKR